MKNSTYAAGLVLSSLLVACGGSDGNEGAPPAGDSDSGDPGATHDAGQDGASASPEAGPSGDDDDTGDDASAPEQDAAPPADAAPSNTPLDIACTPTSVDFQNMDPTGGGKVFTDHVADPTAFVKDAAHRVCTILYKQASEVRSTPKITLIIKSGPGKVADTGGPTTRFYSEYIAGLKTRTDAQITAEIAGVIHHEFTHIYQNFGGDFPMVEGMADYVRYRSGFIPDANRHKGGAWTDGYQVTAFFFVYVDDTYPEAAYKLNQAAKAWPANNAAFKTITGKTVDDLWTDYQASF